MFHFTFLILSLLFIFSVPKILDSSFELRTLRFVGAKNMDVEKIRNVISSSKNLYRISSSRVKEECIKDEWVERCETIKVFPHTLIVNVKEKKPLGILLENEDFFVIGESFGRIEKIKKIEPKDVKRFNSLPLVRKFSDCKLEIPYGAKEYLCFDDRIEIILDSVRIVYPTNLSLYNIQNKVKKILEKFQSPNVIEFLDNNRAIVSF